MLPRTSPSYSLWIQGFSFFAATAFFLVASGYNMIIDSDPLWHVAAGNLIRQQGQIPLTDPWSFSAGDYRWLNVSWLWDTIFSYIVENLGWDGAAAINAVIIAAMLAITYTHCLLRSGNGMASFLTIVLLFIMLLLHLRPVHITHLMIALWMLLLGLYVRGECKTLWLFILPASMIIWVNSHGGFILGFAITGFFLLDLVLKSDHQKSQWLIAIIGMCMLAVFCNPYGSGIIETVIRPLTTVANQYIAEWQPVTFSLGFFINCAFLVLFVILVLGRPSYATRAESWLVYGFLIYGLTTNRALYIFTIMAAPVLAWRLAAFFKDRHDINRNAIAIRKSLFQGLQQRKYLLGSIAVAGVTPAIVSSAFFLSVFPQPHSWPSLKKELQFIEAHYPNGRFINEFALGGYIIYETSGKVPVFVDPRTETAMPKAVFEEYFAFMNGTDGWENILAKYKIDGIILPKHADAGMHDRFKTRKGWKKAFEGENAVIYIYGRD